MQRNTVSGPAAARRREVNNLLRPQSLLSNIDLTPRPSSTVSIGGKLYRRVDDGRADVLVELPRMSPAEQAMRERGVRQAVTMAGSPAAAAAFDVATLLGMSAEQRDRTMKFGEAVGSIFSAAAPLGATRATPGPVFRERLPPESFQRPASRPFTVKAGHPPGVQVSVTAAMVGTGRRTKPRQNPPGWRGNGPRYNEARAHLQAVNLGGSEDLANKMTLNQNPTNHPQMSKFEKDVATRARQGEVVEYTVMPLYRDPNDRPEVVILTATGSRQPPKAVLLSNKPYKRR